MGYLIIRRLSVGSFRSLGRWIQHIWFSGLVGSQPGSLASVGTGSKGRKSHCTCSCGFGMPEDEYRLLG